MIRRFPGPDVELRGMIFEDESTLFRTMGLGVGWSIVMGRRLRGGGGFPKGRRNMLYRDDFGIRMGSCILPVTGMMLFMASMMIIRSLGGVEEIVGSKIRFDFGYDAMQKPCSFWKSVSFLSGSSARLVEGVEFKCSSLIYGWN